MPRRGENIRKRQDKRWEGRYIVSYDEVTGKARYRSVYADAYGEVKRKLAEEKEKGREIRRREGDGILFQTIPRRWLDGMKLRIRPQTHGKYHDLIEKHLIPRLGEMDIRDLTTSAVHQFLDQQSQSGRLNGTGGVAAGTLRTMVYIIRSALDFAADEGLCAPMRGKIIQPPAETAEVVALTLEEQRQLEEYLWDDPDRSRQGILLCLYTGLRLGEICGLTWGDIDLDERVIRVRRAVQRVHYPEGSHTGKRTELNVGKPKSASSVREIPLPSFMASLLNLTSEAKDRETMKNCYFLTGNEKAMEPRTYQYRFKTYLKAAGLPSVKFHVLRHTFATRCLTSGADVKSLSEILGHSNANITLDRYVHSSLQIKRLQIERAVPAFWGQKSGQLAENL